MNEAYKYRIHTLGLSKLSKITSGTVLAFAEFINEELRYDKNVAHLLPLPHDRKEVAEMLRNGIIFCKLLNSIEEDMIDEMNIIVDIMTDNRRLSNMIENQTQFISVDTLLFDTIWMLIRYKMSKGILKNISKSNVPVKKFPNLEQFILTWANQKLNRDGSSSAMNFAGDFADSNRFLSILHQIDSKIGPIKLYSGLTAEKRANVMLEHARDLLGNIDITDEDIIGKNEQLNLMFLYSLYMYSNKQQMNKPIKSNKDFENERISFVLKKEEENNVFSNMDSRNINNNKKMNMNSKNDNNSKSSKKDEYDINNEVKLKKECSWSAFINDVNDKNESIFSKLKCNKVVPASDEDDYIIDQLADELSNATFSSQSSKSKVYNKIKQLKDKYCYLKNSIEVLKREQARNEEHTGRLRLLYTKYQTIEQLCTAIYGSLTLGNISSVCSISGFLTKKARFSYNFKNRYFVLRENFLFYYRSDRDKNEKASGAIRVDNSIVKISENRQFQSIDESCILSIESSNSGNNGKPLTFFVAGEFEEMERWRHAIELASAWWTTSSAFDSYW